MKVLSLFDGMSCGRIALGRAGIKVDNYFASEVDKYAIKVTMANYPDTVQLGDARKVKADDLPKIDLLLGGSPCQGFSQAGKGGKFNDPRSKLFWEYVRILNECRERNPDILFLLENVRMDKYSEGVISDALGLDPVMINSALVSAQNRERLYWSNIRTEEHTMFGHLKTAIPQPEDRGILLKDILETSGTGAIKNMGEIQERREKAMNLDANYFKGIDNHGQRTLVQEHILSNAAMARIARRKYSRPQVMPDKTGTLTCKNNSGQLSMDSGTTLVPVCCIQIGEADLNGHDSIKQVYSPEGKGPSLTTMQGGHREPKVGITRRDNDGIRRLAELDNKTGPLLSRYYKGVESDGASFVNAGEKQKGDEFDYKKELTHWRKLTPLECERLQCVPDGFTNHVSSTQRYKMLGNGFTVDVIAHIFSFLPERFKSAM